VLAAMLLEQSRVVKLEGSAITVAGRFAVPVDGHGFLSLQWNDDEAGRGARGTMKRSIPAWRLLVNRDDDDNARGVRHHDNDLAGKVVIVTDSRRETTWPTPVGRLSHAAILAQTLSDLLHGQGVSRAAPEVDFWFTVAFALVGGVLAVAWSSLMRRPGWLAWVATIVIVASVHAFLARQIFVTQQRQVVVVAPLLAFGLTFLASLGYARTLEQSLRDFMLRALGGAVRADVFRLVERDLKLMRPERRALTVYFSDIEGFTQVADAKEPLEVVKVLQQYLTESTNLVLDRDGYDDKYLGDGLMAFWGAPIALENAEATACTAALAIQAHFEERRSAWEKVCGRPLVLRAGIEAGATLVGEMGTSHRVNYTVMGEPVARAFRLEALAKKYDARILVGPEVAKAAGERFALREVDTVHSRGDTPTPIFELMGVKTDLDQPHLDALTGWAAAMVLWKARKVAEAKVAFEALAAKQPDDKLAARYVARCAWALANPLPESWDGVYPGP
jgi:adenylate cyclase